MMYELYTYVKLKNTFFVINKLFACIWNIIAYLPTRMYVSFRTVVI